MKDSKSTEALGRSFNRKKKTDMRDKSANRARDNQTDRMIQTARTQKSELATQRVILNNMQSQTTELSQALYSKIPQITLCNAKGITHKPNVSKIGNRKAGQFRSASRTRFTNPNTERYKLPTSQEKFRAIPENAKYQSEEKEQL